MSAEADDLRKELRLTQQLLTLSEALRHRLQAENEVLKAGAAPARRVGMHPAHAAPYGGQHA